MGEQPWHVSHRADHLEVWANDHASERTSETDAAIWCVRDFLTALSPSGEG